MKSKGIFGVIIKAQRFAILPPLFILWFIPWFIFLLWGIHHASAAGSAAFRTETVVQPYLGITPVFGRWNTAIPWVYNPTLAPALFSDTDTVVRLLKEAMAEWEGVCGVRFNYQGIDTTIKNMSDDHLVVVHWGSAGGAAASAGPSRRYNSDSAKTLGYNPYTDGSLEINRFHDWTNGGQYTTAMMNRAFSSVLVHELGHLMGLGHSNNPVSILYAAPYNDVRHPLEDDVTAAQAFYGPSTNPTTVTKYTPPSAGVSPFTNSFLYLNPAASNDINVGSDVRVTEISQNTSGSDALIFRTTFNAPLNKIIEFHVIDPFEYVIHEIYEAISKEESGAYTFSKEIGSVDILKNIPGQYHVYITANNRLLVDHPFTVTSTPEWNHPPLASVSYSAIYGSSPLTVTADLIASDPEGYGMSATWHIPEQGIIDENGFNGQATKILTFSEVGEYIVFVAVNDNGPRYDGSGYHSSADRAGDGVQTLLRQVITVTDSISPTVGANQSVERGRGVTVTLKGGTTDGAATHYTWTVVKVPSGSLMTTASLDNGSGSIRDPDNLVATFQPDKTGVYLLSLATINRGGVVSAASTTTITVYGYSVVLPSAVRAGEMFHLLADIFIDGVAVKNYTWDFGDGTAVAMGAAPSHTFVKPGRYVVTLTATMANEQVIHGRYPLTVAEGRYSIHGTLSGLAKGDSIDLVAVSAATRRGDKIKVDGTGHDVPFTIQDLPPAIDYRLYMPTTVYIGGYWGGVAGGAGTEPSSLVDPIHAKNIDLSTENAKDIHIKVDKGRDLNVTLSGLTEGNAFELSAWSAVRGNFVTRTVSPVATARVTVTLSGLLPVSDTLLSIKALNGSDYRGGFYNGDGNVPAAIARAKRLDLSQNDLSISLTMEVGRSIRGTLENLAEGERVWVEAWSDNTAQGGSVTMTHDGDYSILGLLPADDYKVCVKVETQAGGCYSGLSGVGLVSFPMAAMLDLSAGSRTGIDLTLESGRTIQGTVVGLSDSDVAWVEAFSPSASHWSTSQVERDGSFLLQGLHEAEDYHLTVRAEGYKIPKAQTVNLREVTSSVVHFNLFKGEKIQGRITGLKAGDVVTVEARSQTTGYRQEVTLLATDTTPVSYVLHGLVDASDFVISIQTLHGRFFYGAHGTVRGIDQAKTLSVVGGHAVSGIDFDVSAAVSFKIMGNMSGLGSTHVDHVVTLNAWSVSGNFGSVSRVGDGAFVLSSLPSDNYYLAIDASGFVFMFYNGSGWSPDFESAATLSVVADVRDLTIPLILGHTLSGTVSHLDSTVAGAYVSAWDHTKGIGGNALSWLDGTYRISGLADGAYQMTAQASEGRAVRDSVFVQGADVAGQGLVLTKAAGSIRGRTSAGAMLLLYAANGDFVTSTVADADGIYLFTGLETDMTYRVDVDTDDHLDSVEATEKATPTVDHK